MICDVSEIKEFRHCRRKWQLSSRNQFHMAPIVTPTAFKVGIVFHECLHKLYLGKDIEEVMDYCRGELEVSNPKELPMVLSMIKGYDREVMPADECFVPLDIEWHFQYRPYDLIDEEGRDILNQLGYGATLDGEADLWIAGSIDMIALDVNSNKVWGFEHKTAKNFRNNTYLWMDEQPRLYYAALQQWVAQYNAQHNTKVELGGVFINEVQKLIRSFETHRSTLVYSPDDLRNFMISLLTSVAECHRYVNNDTLPRLPMPDMMTCAFCQYNTICQTFQYQNLDKEALLTEFRHEFKVREDDHLNEKVEVNKE